MDIGFVHPTWPGGEGTGAAHSATQIVTGLADRGHTVTAYCRETPGINPTVPDGIDLVDLDLDRFPYHSSTVLNGELLDRLDELGAHDVVHSYLPSAIPALTEVATETTAATVSTLNAYGGVCPKNDLLYRGSTQCTDNSPSKCVECIVRASRGHGLGYWTKRTVGRLGNLRMVRKGLSGVNSIDGFRAPSGHVRDNYADLGFPREKIRVIPHPIDETFLVEHTSDFQEPIEMLYVGSLEHQKGVDKLVPIVVGLREHDIDVQLAVVGDGPERSKMERQASDSSVGDWIDFRGRVPNATLPAVYATHDLLIHPGIWEEPLARVYIEALATGTPIVTTEYGDIENIIGKGGATTDGTIAGFVDVIRQLIRQEQLIGLSDGTRNSVHRYRSEEILTHIESLYSTVVNG